MLEANVFFMGWLKKGKGNSRRHLAEVVISRAFSPHVNTL